MNSPSIQVHAAALALIARWVGRAAAQPARATASAICSSIGRTPPRPPPSADAIPPPRTATAAPDAPQAQRAWTASTVPMRLLPTTARQYRQQQRRGFASSASSTTAGAGGSAAGRSDQDDGTIPATNMIDPELLSLLACPLTQQTLAQVANANTANSANSADANAGFLLSSAAGARFPVGRDGVPRLRPLQDGELVPVDEDDAL